LPTIISAIAYKESGIIAEAVPALWKTRNHPQAFSCSIRICRNQEGISRQDGQNGESELACVLLVAICRMRSPLQDIERGPGCPGFIRAIAFFPGTGGLYCQQVDLPELDEMKNAVLIARGRRFLMPIECGKYAEDEFGKDTDYSA